MATVDLPYTLPEVRSPEQAQLFMEQVLIPASDIAAGCSFKDNGLYLTSRENNISTHDGPGGWTTIGFEAVRLQPEKDPDEILYHVWSQNAADTDTIPFSEEATKLAAIMARNGAFGEAFVEKLLGDGLDELEADENVEFEYEDEVVEAHEFYLCNRTLKPFYYFDYMYSRNGVVICTNSSIVQGSEEVNPSVVERYEELLEQGSSDPNTNEFTAAFSLYDIELMAGILNRLGLLASNR